MKRLQLPFFFLFSVFSMVSAQQGNVAFFRLSGSSNAVISAFDPVGGTITLLNSIVGVTNQIQRSTNLMGSTNWLDYVQVVATSSAVTNKLIDLSPPEGMVYIPAGPFLMGDVNGEGSVSQETPVHTVYIDGFYMSRHETTKAQWDAVYSWATNNNYYFDNPGLGKASNHPVYYVNWFDAVIWCNARSEMEGLTPCYHRNGNTYTSRQGFGDVIPYCNWYANGYRLPTEAEWEKAARAGVAGNIFSWGDFITHSYANYYSSGSEAYDNNPTDGFHPNYSATYPYTNPVGVFSPNGYGIYGMAGNVSEWCYDGFVWNYYTVSPASNPRGSTYRQRSVRGGQCQGGTAYNARSSFRLNRDPMFLDFTGIRACRSLK